MKIPHDFLVREPENADTIVCENRVALGVPIARLYIRIVRPAIEFDGGSHRWRVEINNRISDRVLTTKLHAKLLPSNALPENEFGCGHGRAEA